MKLRTLHLGNDFWFRVMFIPFMGLSIPYITDMIPDDIFLESFLSLNPFLYTFFMVIFIFEANRSLMLYSADNLRIDYETLTLNLFKRIFFQLLISFILLFFFFCIWYSKILSSKDYHHLMFNNILMGLIITLIIILIYESGFFFNKWVALLTKSQMIETNNVKSQINLLRNQLAPHFMFNSLSTLMSLIELDKDKAIDFLSRFSNSYRYILSHSEDVTVDIEEELKFVEDYISIFKSNYGDHCIVSEINIPRKVKGFKVPTLSIQMLIENALKHNLYSDKKPLGIKIYTNPKCTHLIVENELRYKKSRNSTRLGLESINDRYKLIAGQSIIINKYPLSFVVQLPLIKN